MVAGEAGTTVHICLLGYSLCSAACWSDTDSSRADPLVRVSALSLSVKASKQLQRWQMGCELWARLPRWNRFWAHLAQRLNLQCCPCFSSLLEGREGYHRAFLPRLCPHRIMPGHEIASSASCNCLSSLTVSVRPFSAAGFCVL